VDWAGPEHASVYSLADGKTWRLAGTPNEDGGIVGWTSDSKNILWWEPTNTLASIFVLNIDGKKIAEWTKTGNELLAIPYLNDGGNYLGFTLQNPQKLPQAYVSSLASYAPIKVSNINADKANAALPKTEVIKWKAADGKQIGTVDVSLDYKPGQKFHLF
jgi:hypothetical protein